MDCRDDVPELAGEMHSMWVVVSRFGVLSGWPDEYTARHAQMVYEEETKEPARVIVVDVWVPRG